MCGNEGLFTVFVGLSNYTLTEIYGNFFPIKMDGVSRFLLFLHITQCYIKKIDIECLIN